MDLGLLQREIAEIFGVDECTIQNWECSNSQPQVLMIPRIIKFLDYNPLGEGSDSSHPIFLRTLGDHLLRNRLDKGITQKHLANKLGVSVDAIRDWEKNRSDPQLNNIVNIIDYLGYDPLTR